MRYWAPPLRWNEGIEGMAKTGQGAVVNYRMLAVGAALGTMLVVSVGWFAWREKDRLCLHDYLM